MSDSSNNVTVIEVRSTGDGSVEETESSDNDGELTDGDFGDSECDDAVQAGGDGQVPCNQTMNGQVNGKLNGAGPKKAEYARLSSYEDDDLANGKKNSGNEDIGIVGILGKDHDKAEARLAARRQARAEAREIRMRELERQQKEQEENADRVYDMYTGDPPTRSSRVAGGTPLAVAGGRLSTGLGVGTPVAYHSSRRSSEDSLEELGSIRDIRHELKEVEEKFRKAMILNAQLDNDKASFSYQLELLKDKLEDLQEQYTQLQREHKDKCRSHEALVRECRSTREELERYTAALALRDRCIQEAGLELVPVETDGEGAGAALVSRAGREALEAAGHGALDVRLQTLCSERQALETEVTQLKAQLEEERSKKKTNSHNSVHNGPMNGSDSDSDSFEHQRENSKLVADYKFRACKAEQDVLTLQATVARLDSQVTRLKSAMEEAEQMENELKGDRRKLQREAREAQNRVEELETENSHLNKRLDKLKNAKSALLKEL